MNSGLYINLRSLCGLNIFTCFVLRFRPLMSLTCVLGTAKIFARNLSKSLFALLSTGKAVIRLSSCRHIHQQFHYFWHWVVYKDLKEDLHSATYKKHTFVLVHYDSCSRIHHCLCPMSKWIEQQ